MSRIFTYYSQYQSVRGTMSTLPAWARSIVWIAAIPGIILLALSLLALGVSILALLVLTLPAYRMVGALAGRPTDPRAPAANEMATEGVFVETPPDAVFDPQTPSDERPARRQIDVRIVEDPQ